MKHIYDTGESRFFSSDIFLNKNKVNGKEPYHSHNFIEIVYIAEGKGIHIIEDKEFAVSEGDVILIDYDVAHIFISENDSLVVYNCVFKPTFLDPSLHNSRSFKDILNHFTMNAFSKIEFENFKNLSSTGQNKYSISSIYNKMIDEYNSRQLGYIEMLRADLLEMLVNILRLDFEHSEPKIFLVNRIIEYIVGNYTHDISLEQLSKISFLSKTHLSRIFKKHTNLTITEFIQKIRVEEAVKLIIATDMKMPEIAYKVGYSDIKHFNYIFKKITNKTPSNFRKARNFKKH